MMAARNEILPPAAPARGAQGVGERERLPWPLACGLVVVMSLACWVVVGMTARLIAAAAGAPA